MKCEKCGKSHNGEYGSGRFCSSYCAHSNPKSDLVKAKISEGVRAQLKQKGAYYSLPYTCKQCGKAFRKTDTHKSTRYCPEHKKLSSHQVRFEDLKRDHSRKRRLLKERGHQCEVCKLTEWMGKPIPIEIDHIDGDCTNNDRSNLRLICPNCHAQTPTYKALNKGNVLGKRKKLYEKYSPFSYREEKIKETQ